MNRPNSIVIINKQLHDQILNQYLSEFKETIASHHEKRFGENNGKTDKTQCFVLKMINEILK